MSDAAHTFLPLFAFMLIPVWIPVLAISAGRLLEVVRPRREHPVLAQVRARRHAMRVADPAVQTA
jgi:hypothetical protein